MVTGVMTGVPGKGDADGDRIADDLDAALEQAGPGDRVRVIVQGVGPAKASRAASSLHVGRTYRTIRGFAGSLTAGQVRSLARAPGVTRIELNGTVRLMDASGNQDYGVTAARAAGAATDGALDGSGVGICFIDTGIDSQHEALAGRVLGWKDWVNDQTSPYDDHGHGTHVAGIAAGRPVAGPQAYAGVAGAASLVAAKVLASSGFGEDADVVSAIEWCAARDDVDVISMSLGSPGSDGSDAGSQAADAAVAAGKVVVAAAGNGGDAPSTITSPGVATDVITVGAASDPSALAGTSDTDSGLYLAGFSSRGPTTNPAAPTKPDVVAPGISVMSAKSGTAAGYVSMSGTSMATPFVAGVVALGLEAAPSVTPAQLKQALRASSHDVGPIGPDNDWGAGLVDARAFVAALGAAAPGAVAWPDQQLLSGTVAAGATVDFPFTVATAGQPLGVSLRTVNGHATCLLPVGNTCWYGYEWSPDIDAYLVNPSGSVVAMSRCMLEASNGNCGAPGRFETLGISSATAGTWQLRVESFSGAGSFEATLIGALGSPEPPPPPPPTPPAAPTGLSVTATTTSTIGLAWSDVSNDEDGFTLQRCDGGSCPAFITIATLPAGTTSYLDSGLAAGTSYSYRVRAFNSGGESAWSEATGRTETPPLTAPVAPSGLVANAVSANRVNLTWVDRSDNETGFRVLRCTGSKCTPVAVLVTLASGTTSFADLSVKPRTTYRYRVQAFNAAGVGTSAIVKATTPRR
jgi:serine protease AprX